VSGQYVVATKGKWASPDPLTYRYQWLACPTATTPVTSCIQAGSDSSHYLLSSADIGDYITVTVTAADKEHQPTSATAKAAGPVKS
jgi:hypothetical protein